MVPFKTLNVTVHSEDGGKFKKKKKTSVISFDMFHIQGSGCCVFLTCSRQGFVNMYQEYSLSFVRPCLASCNVLLMNIDT